MRESTSFFVCLYVSALFGSILCLQATAQKPTPAGAASKSAAAQRVDYPEDGVILGNGWDSYGEKKTNAVCVTFDQNEVTGQVKWENVRSVTDQYSLMNELQVSAQAQVQALGSTFSSKMNFIDRTQINNEFSNFAMRATVQNGVKYLIPKSETGMIAIAPSFLEIAQKDPGKFEAICGDSFVSAVYGGAEIDALLTFATRSQEDHSVLETSLSFSGWNVEATASAQKTVDTVRKSTQLNISAWQSGGSGTDFSLSQEDLNKMVKELPASAASDPRPYEIGITRYDSLPNWPGTTGAWNSVAYRDIASQYLKLISLYKQMSAILAAGNQANYIFDRGVTVQMLRTVQDQVLRISQDIKERGEECLNSEGQKCALPDADRVSDYTFRAHMPVAHHSFQLESDLEKATTDLAAMTASLKDIQSQIDKMGFACKMSNACDELNFKFVITLNAVNMDQAAVTNLKAAYPAALKEAIAETWLRSVNTARCRTNVQDAGCLSNSDLEKYVATIDQAPAK